MRIKKKQLQIIWEILLGIPKTIFINFKYLPLKQAIYFPIIVSRYCNLLECSGRIKICGEVKTGMILLGIGNVGIFDKRKSRSILEVSEEALIIFRGKARFGNGFKLSVSGEIEFGENFTVTAESSILCHKNIKFGDNVLISWQNMIMDSDIHSIYRGGRKSNKTLPILFGNNIWVGCQCIILKGTVIKDNTVIAAGSLLRKKIDEENVLIAGQDGKIVDRNINWTR